MKIFGWVKLINLFVNELGHSTIIEELAAALTLKPTVLITVIGGGGLLCGILQGLHR